MKNALLTLAAMASLCGIASAQVSNVGLVGYWPFDGNAIDYSGNNNNGTVYGATPTADRFGNPAHAYHFDGLSNIIVVPNAPTIDMAPADDFTIAVWMKTDAGNINGNALAKHHTGYWNGYSIFSNNQQDPGYCMQANHVSFYTASGAQQDACSDNAVCADTSKWVFVVCEHTAATNSNTLFINTTPQADIGTSSGSISNAEALSFGGVIQCNCGYYKGALDGVRIYKRLLTQNEINTLYVENPAGIESASADPLNVSVFPNPANGDFHFSYIAGDSKHTTVEVFDQLGNLVYSDEQDAHPGRNESVMNLQGFANGIYFFRLKSGENLSVTKLILAQ